jgi:hypothetical protein
VTVSVRLTVTGSGAFETSVALNAPPAQ